MPAGGEVLSKSEQRPHYHQSTQIRLKHFVKDVKLPNHYPSVLDREEHSVQGRQCLPIQHCERKREKEKRNKKQSVAGVDWI